MFIGSRPRACCWRWTKSKPTNAPARTTCLCTAPASSWWTNTDAFAAPSTEPSRPHSKRSWKPYRLCFRRTRHEFDRFARGKRLPERVERDFFVCGLLFHTARRQDGAQELYGVGFCQFDGFFGLLPDLSHWNADSLRQRTHRIPRPSMVSPDLSVHPVQSPRAGDCDCAARADYAATGRQATLRAPQKNRPLDVADLDVRFGDGRDDLLVPLPDLPAALTESAFHLRSAALPTRAPIGWEVFRPG